MNLKIGVYSLFFLSAFANASPTDFYTRKVSGSAIKKLQSEEPMDCRAHISDVICLVDKQEKVGTLGEEDEAEKKCIPGGKDYAVYFEKLYDAYPPVLQKVFCSLDFLFIEQEFEGTAYGGSLTDENGKVIGAVMGIRKSVLDENLDLTTWAGWKEQLSFGGVVDSYTVTEELPTIKTSSDAKVSDFLYFVVAHEFGHILDFANKLNEATNCKKPEKEGDQEECELRKDSWGAIGWASNLKPKAENDFTNRSGLCFYWCKGNTLQKQEIDPLYESMAKTDFISTYSASNPWDDFADSLAYYLMNQNLSTSYAVETGSGGSYDVMEKLKSPLFERKHQFIEDFLKKEDIIYP